MREVHTHTHTHTHTSSEVKIHFTDLHNVDDLENMRVSHETQPKVVVLV